MGKQCVGDKVTEKGGDKKKRCEEETRVPKTTVQGLDSHHNVELEIIATKSHDLM